MKTAKDWIKEYWVPVIIGIGLVVLALPTWLKFIPGEVANLIMVGALVVITWWYARATRDIAQTAKDQGEYIKRQADASVAMAKAMTETLELSYVPALDIAKSSTLRVTKDGVLITVENEGKAKAENIKVACRYAGSLYRGDLPGLLEPGGRKQVFCVQAGTYDHSEIAVFGEKWGTLTVAISGTDACGRPLSQKIAKITCEELRNRQPNIELPPMVL